MNGDKAAFSIGILLENMQGGSFTGDSEGEICKIPCRRASFFIGALLGNLELVVSWDF
jgi:hypothetical protein